MDVAFMLLKSAELAAAGRLVSFGRQWCAAHGVTEPEFNLGGGMAVDYTQSADCGLYGSGTWWRSGWPGRTPGTFPTTGSSCTRPPRFIT